MGRALGAGNGAPGWTSGLAASHGPPRLSRLVVRPMNPTSRAHPSAVLSALALLAGAATSSCNNPYDLLVHDRFEQAGFNSQVDILWVVDNSNSMAEIQQEVQSNFGSFIEQFGNPSAADGQELAYATITDATVAFSEFLTNQERFLNFQMGVVTSDIEAPGNGNQGNIRSLAPIGGPGCEPPEILKPTSESLNQDFTTLVDVGVGGSGTEQGMLAAAFALCKSQDQTFWDGIDARPDDDPVKMICNQVPATDRSCNDGFLRDGSATVVIMIGDEGDDSNRSALFPPQSTVDACIKAHGNDPTFQDCECRLEWLLDFFSGFSRPVIFANIGPTYQESTVPVTWCDGSQISYAGPCNPFGNTVCALDFFQQSACLTGGLFEPIQQTTTENDPTTCVTADFSVALQNIGVLISNLAKGWTLSAIPDVETISVYVNGEAVPQQGGETASGGWRYIPQERSIGFSGEWVPRFNETVDVYYYPAFDRRSQMGRDLPF